MKYLNDITYDFCSVQVDAPTPAGTRPAAWTPQGWVAASLTPLSSLAGKSIDSRYFDVL